MRVRLKDGDQVILNTIDLARREKDCCAFFEFRLELLPDQVWLEIGAPAEAAAILDALISPGTAGTPFARAEHTQGRSPVAIPTRPSPRRRDRLRGHHRSQPHHGLKVCAVGAAH